MVGAGLGGLAAAVTLQARGVATTVIEAGPRPGGKAGIASVDGVSFDTGPSVLTLTGILRDLLAEAEVALEDVLTLRRPEPAFRYVWPDGTVLDVAQDPGETEATVRRVLGPEAAADFAGFMAYSRTIWEAAAPHFVLAPAPSVGRVVGLGLTGLSAVGRIDPFRSMWGAIRARVRSPHLRDLFARFATYNGSDPRRAPATLNCIAHVEMGLGSYGVEGGIHELPRALVTVLERLGGRVRTGAPVEAIEADGEGVSAVRLRGGERLAARRVVVNADVAHLVRDLLPERARHGLPAVRHRSTSGWTAVARVPARADRVGHTALFPRAYLDEFRDLFDREVPPDAPTVYLCDQARAHGRAGWSDGVPLFIMANAPAEPEGGPTPEATWGSLRERVLERLHAAELLPADAPIVWERSPAGLARAFPGSRGALYGAASNDPFAAFRRPPNAVSRIPGLYLASGSAHPGGGMPLCLQSGRLAAEALTRDLGVS